MPIAPNDFVHLHLHSEFSLLDGLGRINDLVSEASAHGFDALAITDHGSLYGAMAFYQACRARQIKPIIGVEAYVARRSMSDREGKADAQPYHVTLLARDWNGYQNLCRIITAAHLDGYYYKPRLDRELLARYSEGIIGMSACLGGEVAKALEVDDYESARRVVGEYREILGRKLRIIGQTQEAESFTTKVKTMDFSKAVKDLGHDPVVTPEEGIRRTVEWMKWFYRLQD